MNLLDRILGREAAAPGALETALHEIDKLNERIDIKESLGSLELALEDRGWEQLTQDMNGAFSRNGLRKASHLSRLMFLANPLIKNGLNARAAYVHGQGVGITARANGDEGMQDVNAVIQEFLDDPSNRSNLTGGQAKIRLENSLGTDGNFFVACFADPLDGKVAARTLPFDEIVEVITAPGDRGTVHYYRRRWREGNVDHEELYPSLRYRPQIRQKYFQDTPQGPELKINWDSPVYHMHDNGLDGWQFGIGDAYAALPWARAYKEFLEDWTLLVKALSQIAYKMVPKKGVASQQARQAANVMGTLPAGSTAVMTEDQDMVAMPKSGATIDSESGRPVQTMIAAALGLPVTTLSADPGQTGARAVAETLNQPTRLGFTLRQELWTEMFRAILGYVIDQAVLAPRGPLKGTSTRRGDTLTVALAGNDDRTLDIVWPDLNEVPIETIMEAVEKADTLGVPKLTLLALALRALGVRDPDEILEKVTDDDGNFIDPVATAGQAAVDAHRRGDDPAETIR